MRIAVTLATALLLALPAFAGEKSPLGEALKDIDVADHWIYDDWPRAVAEARASGKPLLVVLRCVPCPPGKALDLAVMQPDKELEAVEKQFVCVRLIQGNRLDLDLFQYDYDMSWAAMFLNADRTIYGRYGSRNATGPESDALLSPTGFRRAAERALQLHAEYPANKPALVAKTGPKSAYAAPNEIPGLEERPSVATERKNCIHCHMIKEFSLRAKWEAGKLTSADLYVYPQPTNLGFDLILDDGLKVKSVVTGSPAAEAGIAAGDELETLGGQPLVSRADVQWVLNAAPQEGELPVIFKRNGQSQTRHISLDGDWKKSDVAWRASSWYGLRQGLKVEPLPSAEKQSRGLPSHGGALVVKGMFGKGAQPLQKAGLKTGDVIVAVDGREAPQSESDFLVDLRLKHGPRDSVRFTVLRGKERRELTIPMW